MQKFIFAKRPYDAQTGNYSTPEFAQYCLTEQDGSFTKLAQICARTDAKNTVYLFDAEIDGSSLAAISALDSTLIWPGNANDVSTFLTAEGWVKADAEKYFTDITGYDEGISSSFAAIIALMQE